MHVMDYENHSMLSRHTSSLICEERPRLNCVKMEVPAVQLPII